MPVQRRKSKMKAHQLTPEVFAAFDAGERRAAARAEAPALACLAAGYGPRRTGSHMVPRRAGPYRGPTPWRSGRKYSQR